MARMERCLTRHPWRTYAAVVDVTPEVFAVGRPLLIVADGKGRTVVHHIAGWSWHRLLGRTREVWIAGDPHGPCVMSPPGGESPLWLRPVGFVTRFRLGRLNEKHVTTGDAEAHLG